MSLSVDYNYQFALKLIKKNQAGGLSSKDFEFQWNDAQASYQDDLLGRFQARNTGKEGANTGLITNETILQKLSPFIKNTTLSVVSGIANKPSGFVYRLALRVGNDDVIKLNHGQIGNVLNSVIDPPSNDDKHYYVVEYEGYFAFMPESITSVKLDYVTVPTNVVWGYTIDVNGRQVYNAASSVQPIWDDNSCREITKRMLANLGVSFKDADFLNFGKSVQMTGE